MLALPGANGIADINIFRKGLGLGFMSIFQNLCGCARRGRRSNRGRERPKSNSRAISKFCTMQPFVQSAASVTLGSPSAIRSVAAFCLTGAAAPGIDGPDRTLTIWSDAAPQLHQTSH